MASLMSTEENWRRVLPLTHTQEISLSLSQAYVSLPGLKCEGEKICTCIYLCVYLFVLSRQSLCIVRLPA